MKIKLIASIVALIIVLGTLGFIGYGYYDKETYKVSHPIVTMEIEGYGTVKMELYPEMAPNAVRTFIKLINEGFYNGLTFHRVEENLLIQGGDKNGDGSGTSTVNIDGEFAKNGYEYNTLKFERGTLGLARQDFSAYAQYGANIVTEGYNSGYNQFFIMTKDMPSFDGLYTSYGKVIEGMEFVDKISELKTKVEVNEETKEETETSMPEKPPVIKSITVDTLGVNYGEPTTHPAFDLNGWITQLYYGGALNI